MDVFAHRRLQMLTQQSRGSGPHSELRVLKVDPSRIGAIIGKQGATIQRLHAEFPDMDMDLDSTRAILTLLGTCDTNRLAVQRVSSIAALTEVDLGHDHRVVLHCSAKTSGASYARRSRAGEVGCFMDDVGFDHVDRTDALERVQSIVDQWETVFLLRNLRVPHDGSHPVKFALAGSARDVLLVQQSFERSGIYTWHHYTMDIMGIGESARAELLDAVYLSRPVMVPAAGSEAAFLRVQNEELSRLPDVMLALQQIDPCITGEP